MIRAFCDQVVAKLVDGSYTRIRNLEVSKYTWIHLAKWLNLWHNEWLGASLEGLMGGC